MALDWIGVSWRGFPTWRHGGGEGRGRDSIMAFQHRFYDVKACLGGRDIEGVIGIPQLRFHVHPEELLLCDQGDPLEVHGQVVRAKPAGIPAERSESTKWQLFGGDFKRRLPSLRLMTSPS